MKMRKLSCNFFFICISANLLICILFFSCAQIVNPNGGQKDNEPPRTVKYSPDSAQINFSSKKIVISFDEYIQLNDLQKQLVISPPMKTQPEIRTKGKSLIIELNDTLKQNTTYVFSFGDAIRDITESNPIPNFRYVFSTGNYIDSLTLSGTVKFASDLKSEKGILVMLYDDPSDSVQSKRLPLYMTKTKEDGSYKITNIHPGTYKVFALKDANANYLYDLPTESIAFSDTLIKISKKTALNLYLFKEEPKKQKLLKAYFPEHGHLVFSFALPVNDLLKLNFLSSEPKQNVIYEYSKNTDTLHYWFADDLKDSMRIQVLQGDAILDTIRIKPAGIAQKSIAGRGEKWGLRITTNVKKAIPLDLNKPVVLKFNHPVQSKELTRQQEDTMRMNFNKKILFTEDSIRLSFDSLSFPYGQRSAKIRKEISTSSNDGSGISSGSFAFRNWKENAKYHLFIPPGTYTDIFGLKNDTILLDFKTSEEKEYGSVKLNLKMKIRIAYILELTNDKGEVYDFSSSDKGVFNYMLLPPGPYKLRIIYDKNGDGKWSTGNYQLKRKPETVIWYSASITVRSNWETEIDWKLE